MTGGELLVQSLLNQDVGVVFALPGIQLDWAFDALYGERARIRVIHPRHEQAASYMADGFARAAGSPGVCMVVPGPGVLNSLSGLATAYACGSPVLCLSGEVNTRDLGQGRGVLHEIRDQRAALMSVIDRVDVAETPDKIPALVGDAFRVLLSERSRPAAIEMPSDVLACQSGARPTPKVHVARAQGDPDLLESAARALGAAERPLIFAGGGCVRSAASVELVQLAETLEAPVVMSVNGKGALSSRHRLAHSLLSAPLLFPESDVILVVGSRLLLPRDARWAPQTGQTLIHVDADPARIGVNHHADIAIAADARSALAQLGELVSRLNRPRRRDDERHEAARLQVGRVVEGYEQGAYVRAMRDELADDAIVVNGMTQVGHWAVNGFDVYEPGAWIGYGYQGTLGYEVGTALGAKVGRPGRQVVAVAGDGGFMYQVEELATAVQHGIDVVLVVFNDGAYGNVKRIQRTRFDGHLIASDLHNPDFIRLGEAFGVESQRVDSAAGLRGALRRALDSEGPQLIEVRIGEFAEAMTPTFLRRLQQPDERSGADRVEV